ncbi:MAG: DUF4494 domain-containing protein [Bacteroidales bacterium]
MNFFEAKIRCEKIMENGLLKKVTETYLIDALSFTEAEARIIQEVSPFITGEFTVSDIKRAKISEIFEDETGDRFFIAVVAFVTISERSGAEKETKVNILVQASDIDEAKDNLRKGMNGTMADYVIKSIKETDIIDVYKFERE